VRVIVDTNILVSGLISDSGPPARIVDAILKGNVIPVLSLATFAELEDVLHRPHLQVYFRRAGVTPYHLLAALERVAQFVSTRPSQAPIRDNKDRPFLELAASRPAPDFIITGDKDFEQGRYENVPVISATLFVKEILESH
jgi:putative PIN family toxin of toxin-antitoxin system